MWDTVGWTALVMGLVGGSHCLAMCAAPCAVVTGWPATAPSEQRVIPIRPAKPAPHASARLRLVLFHLGRGIGYGVMGALAAAAMEVLAWTSDQAAALRPLWTFAHVAVLAWGLLMLLQARQPVWVEQAGRHVWQRMEPLVRGRAGAVGAGGLWALMPCGLLYSALLVAALSGGPLQGAGTMLLFAAGSGVWLVAGPWGWARLRQHVARHRADWGSRIAGALLCGVAVWAMWLEWVYKPSLWCR